MIKVQHFRDKQMFNAKQMYDKDVKITKAGKTFKMYDSIQEANVDTDIYEVARKYSMVGEEKECAQAYMKKNLNELQEGFQEFMDLRSVLDKKIKAQNMWNDLPIEIKQKFNNDVNQFMDEGANWLQKQIKAREEAMAKTQTPQTEEIKQGGLSNEQK